MKKYLRSFGRVKGHKLSKWQESLISEFLLTIAPKNLTNNIWFEIGFGAGEHLIQLINERDDENITIIGCEPYINGAVKAIKYIHDNHCKKAYIYHDDARELLKTLNPKSVEKFFILFPDPWPKKRHHKRRIINQFMIELLISKLSGHGSITIATDHVSYAQWISDILTQYSHKYLKFNSAEECERAGILTRYCQKALARDDEINLFILDNI